MAENISFSVIVPSYNPDEKLVSVVEDLESQGITDIIVINDGSKEECGEFFDAVAQHESVTLLVHEQNKGKGAALKTAFQYVLENRGKTCGVVTADGDAQHRGIDIKACGERMMQNPECIVMGTRDFSLPEVPFKSRNGNKITRMVFKIFIGMTINDTQTGLRAIPTKYLKKMLEVSGDRYEYETNMLLAMDEFDIPFVEERIETVYIEENKTSHFRPFQDSARIYSIIFKHFFKYTIVAILSLVLEQVIQSTIFHFAVGNLSQVATEVCAFLPARFISSVFNFAVNKKVVFKSKVDTGKSLKRYYLLWTAMAAATMLSDYILTNVVFSTRSTVGYTIISLIVKLIMAIMSFRLQKDWVFKKKEEFDG